MRITTFCDLYARDDTGRIEFVLNKIRGEEKNVLVQELDKKTAI